MVYLFKCVPKFVWIAFGLNTVSSTLPMNALWKIAPTRGKNDVQYARLKGRYSGCAVKLVSTRYGHDILCSMRQDLRLLARLKAVLALGQRSARLVKKTVSVSESVLKNASTLFGVSTSQNTTRIMSIEAPIMSVVTGVVAVMLILRMVVELIVIVVITAEVLQIMPVHPVDAQAFAVSLKISQIWRQNGRLICTPRWSAWLSFKKI